jgi:ADP-ribose pyrophosphatase YjhB (NUDIX family)
MRLSTRIRTRLFHAWFLVSRPVTLGVRALVHDEAAGTVLLVRHTYVPGWQFPGGGVERGETAETALSRELLEEANVEMTGPATLVSLHHNARASARDHVALYLVRDFRKLGPKIPDMEIAEAGFFPLDDLPDATTPATRRRLAEVFNSEVPASDW